MKQVLSPVLILGALSILPIEAYAQNDDTDSKWTFTVGTGVFATPTYLGDDDIQLSIFPNLRIEYDNRLILGFDGAEYAVVRTDNLRLGPVFRFQFGRDEDGSNPLAITNTDNTDLVGLGDVDGTPELGGFVEYSLSSFTARVEARQGIGGHDGFIGEADVTYNHSFDLGARQAFVSIGPSISFGDSSFNSAFFDVNAEQSLASGLSTFDADGGINSVGVGVNFFRPLTDKISVAIFADYDRLLGDIADSSLVQERGSENQFTGGLFLNYTF
ncbi:MAG: MipA/OmpV family protein [Pseudomonadota bacterium]